MVLRQVNVFVEQTQFLLYNFQPHSVWENDEIVRRVASDVVVIVVVDDDDGDAVVRRSVDFDYSFESEKFATVVANVEGALEKLVVEEYAEVVASAVAVALEGQ